MKNHMKILLHAKVMDCLLFDAHGQCVALFAKKTNRKKNYYL